MLRKRLGKRAQSTAEYAILIALVIGAALAMQIYVKRGMQGKVKTTVDGKLGSKQYEPYYLSSSSDTDQLSMAKDTTEKGGKVSKRTDIESSTVEREQDVEGVPKE